MAVLRKGEGERLGVIFLTEHSLFNERVRSNMPTALSVFIISDYSKQFCIAEVGVPTRLELNVLDPCRVVAPSPTTEILLSSFETLTNTGLTFLLTLFSVDFCLAWLFLSVFDCLLLVFFLLRPTE